jgi:hypothetical protein
MFYVYVYKDPRPTKNQQVVYVGKGYGDRAWYHWNKRVRHNKGFGAFLALLRREKLEPIIEIIKDGLDEAEAFYEEMNLIALYGRRDLNTGTLFNLTDGGEGTVGAIRTEEWREKARIANSTPEQISRQKAQATLLWSQPEWREKTIAAIRKALQDPEVIARREAGKAAFIHTEEFRQTMSAATSKLWENPEYAQKVTDSQLRAQNTPESRAKKSVNSKKLWETKGDLMAGRIKAARNTESSKAKTSAQAKAQWADPEYAAKQAANNKEIANREEVRAAKRAATKALWANPEWKAKMLAARKKNILDTLSKEG